MTTPKTGLRQFASLLSVLLLVCAFIGLQSRPAHAIYITQYGGVTELANGNSGLCLDVAGQGTYNGAVVDQWSCWGGSNQLWQPVVFNDGSMEIVGQGSGKCLDVANSSWGQQLVIWTCEWGTTQRFWEQTPLGWGCYFFNNLYSNLDIEVYGASTSNGAAVDQWGYNGHYNQCWTPH